MIKILKFVYSVKYYILWLLRNTLIFTKAEYIDDSNLMSKVLDRGHEFSKIFQFPFNVLLLRSQELHFPVIIRVPDILTQPCLIYLSQIHRYSSHLLHYSEVRIATLRLQ